MRKLATFILSLQEKTMIKLITVTLQTRFWQASRIFWEIGLLRWFLLTLVFLPFALRLPNLLHAYPEISIIIWLFFLFSIQFIRNDKVFFKLIQAKTYWIFFIEYSILTIPIIVYFVLHYAWISSLLLIFGLFLIPFFKQTLQTETTGFGTFDLLPPEAFEWKSGFRLQYLGILIVWIGSLVFSFHFLAVLVGIFLLLLISTQFYTQAEDIDWIRLYHLKPTKFLLRKMQLYAKLFFILISPLSLAFLVFHLELYYLIVAVWAAAACLIVFVILGKYAFYEPKKDLTLLQWIYWFVAFCIFVPFLVPVPLFLGFRFYRKAIRNLEDKV